MISVVRTRKSGWIPRRGDRARRILTIRMEMGWGDGVGYIGGWRSDVLAFQLIERPSHPLPTHPPSVPTPAKPSRFRAATMGKRRKLQHVVKVDLGEDVVKKRETIPVVVQQSSKDGRRVAQTVHQVPTPRDKPLAPTFDPFPAYGDSQDCAHPEAHDPTREPNGPERIRPDSTFQDIYADMTTFCSWTLYAFGVWIATGFFGTLCCWRVEWVKEVGHVTYV